ncbi:hypothetical protein ABG79_01157 [Caloramator mitchellensis]|uniref:UPF0102 protein ABG79_01157 n=1 Tax=Caloramator mitchellensis TaxID=908809 RepID=A0A0R3JTT5_CALMK|nr:YraN family protein [Caloramator mitchellensis]KRQ86967.1 hypothetical protein ABG79_01157 [Caloramator mitchellensis]
MFNKKDMGKIGEDLAAKHLTRNGYTIIQKNFRTKFGEIDIIARDGKFLVFVEVKTRRSIEFGYPREAVDWYKQIRIKNLANLYLAKKKQFNEYIRFDVVEIILNEQNDAKSIFLIKNAFE